MFSVSETTEILDVSFSSLPVHVGRVVNRAEHFLKGAGVTDTSAPSRVLRELVENAIEHGNQHDPGLVVSCHVEIDDESMVRITVTDEGNGFAHKSLGLRLPDDPRMKRGCGLAMVHEMASRMSFNPQGNTVSVRVNTL
jgi:anti-sigma regulatory factor (Ser/Thr protein kinase)